MFIIFLVRFLLCFKNLSSQNSNLANNLIGVVSIGVNPAPNSYVSPFTHYVNTDITSLIPSGYTLFGVLGNSNNESVPMTYSTGYASGKHFLRVWAMNNATRGFNLLLVKQFHVFT